MRGLTIAATVLLLLVAAMPAEASGSTLSLSGPRAVAFTDPITIPIRGTLVLDGVACREESVVPVTLRIASATAADATLLSDSFEARVPAGMEVRPRETSELVSLRLAPVSPGEGVVDVVASFALPPDCVALEGAREVEARMQISVTVRSAAQESALIDEGPPPPLGLAQDVPAAVVLCALAAAGGGVAIVRQRVRERAPA